MSFLTSGTLILHVCMGLVRPEFLEFSDRWSPQIENEKFSFSICGDQRSLNARNSGRMKTCMLKSHM